MAFTSPAFDPAKPAGTDLVSDVDTFIKDFKTQVLERQLLEHYSYLTTGTNAGSATDTTATAHGRHIPGKCGVVYYGTTGNITDFLAAGGVNSGCLFFDSTDSVLKVYNGSTLVLAAPSVTANVAGQQAFKVKQTGLALGSASIKTITKLTFNVEDFDYGNNIIVGTSATQSRFIIPVTGVYQFNCQIRISNPTHPDLGGNITIYLYKNTTEVLRASCTFDENVDDVQQGVSCSALENATAADYFEVKYTVDCSHDKTAYATFSGFRVY